MFNLSWCLNDKCNYGKYEWNKEVLFYLLLYIILLLKYISCYCQGYVKFNLFDLGK